MRSLDGKVAAITGAGSGLGRALAHELADKGARLALSDVSAAGLAETMAQLDGQGVTVTSQVVDVADRRAMVGWADEVVDDHGRVNLIFNNAGVTVVSAVEELGFNDFEWLMDINFWGVVHGTQAFLPHLKTSGDGHVVNISSVFGLLAVPGQAAYNSAKFAVRGFTDALRIELDADPCGVSATTVYPGGIKTDIVRSARFSQEQNRDEELAQFERIARTTPNKAARQIIAGVEKNRRRVLVGPDAVLFDVVSRLPAVVPHRIFITLARRHRRRLATGLED